MIAILSKDTISMNLELMQQAIEGFKEIATPEDAITYLGIITSLQATATETQASAKYWLLEAIDEELTRQAKLTGNEKIPPSIKKMRADAKVKESHFTYEYAQRMAANVSHTIDSIRTKISYIKQELDNSKYSNAA